MKGYHTIQLGIPESTISYVRVDWLSPLSAITNDPIGSFSFSSAVNDVESNIGALSSATVTKTCYK